MGYGFVQPAQCQHACYGLKEPVFADAAANQARVQKGCSTAYGAAAQHCCITHPLPRADELLDVAVRRCATATTNSVELFA
jgi:hypothetical protein